MTGSNMKTLFIYIILCLAIGEEHRSLVQSVLGLFDLVPGGANLPWTEHVRVKLAEFFSDMCVGECDETCVSEGELENIGLLKQAWLSFYMLDLCAESTK